MKNTIALESMPRLSTAEFAAMLASNEQIRVDPEYETHDAGQMPTWIAAVRNTPHSSSGYRSKPTTTHWKVSTLLRGLLIASHNIMPSPMQPAVTTSSASAVIFDDTLHAPHPDLGAARDLRVRRDTSGESALAQLSLPARTASDVLPRDIDGIRRHIHHEKHRQAKTRTRYPLVDRQIASIRTLLRQNSADTPDHPAADHATLVNDVVAYLQQNPNNLARVAQHLCRVAHEYGGRRLEMLTESRQHAIVDSWLAERHFGETPKAFVAHLLSPSTPPRGENAVLPYVENVRYRLLDKLEGMTPFLTQLDEQAKAYLSQRVLGKSLPALIWQPIDAEAFGRTEVGTLEWGFIQAALHLASDLGLDVSGWHMSQAHELGEVLGVLVREGAAPAEWSGYFALPAQYYALRQGARPEDNANSSNDEAVLTRALALFHDDALVEYKRNDPFSRLVSALESYQTRPQLALSTLAEKCPNLHHPEDHVISYLDASESYCIDGPGDRHVDDRQNSRIALPKINDIFEKQNQRIAAIAADLDRVLLPLAFFAMNDAETAFIANATVRRAQAKFSAAHTIRNTLAGANPFAVEALTRRLPSDIEFFSVRQDNEERIYALYRNHSFDGGRHDGGKTAASLGYMTERVDRDAQRYRQMFDLATRQFLTFDSDYRLSIVAYDAPLKQSAESMEVLYGQICKHHQAQMETALHERGYEKTTREKVTSFLWSLVPFYSCVSGIARGDHHAIAPCVIDILSLVPLAGQATSMAARFASATSATALAALRQAAATASVRGVLAQSGTILQQASMAGVETLTMNAFTKLGVTALRTVDPGVELLALSGRAALRQTSGLLDRLSAIYPSAKTLSEAIAHRADTLAGAPLLRSQKARLRGISKEVDVVAIGQRQGRDIFVRVNPQTGDRFGSRYYLNSGGELILIPRPVRQTLKVIIEQGMSGRGALKAGIGLAAVHRRPPQAPGNAVLRVEDGEQVVGNVPLPPVDPEPIRTAALPLAIDRPSGSGSDLTPDTVVARRVMARPGEPPLNLIDLAKYELEEVVTRCDLNTLATLSQLNSITRQTVHDVIYYKWSKARLKQELFDAMRADQPHALRLLVREDVRVAKGDNQRAMLSESLLLSLSQHTYSALLAMMKVNGRIVKLNPRSEALDFLHAAIFFNRPNAINAILNCKQYRIRHQDAHIALAIHYRNFEALQALVSSGKFDSNMRVRGLSPLMIELRNHDRDRRFVEYLLSDANVNLENGYVIDASALLNAEKYRAVLKDPRTDVNALYQHREAPANYITPLFSAIERALRVPFETTNFDILMEIDRLDVNKRISVPGGRLMTPIDYVKSYDPDDLGAVAVPLKTYLVTTLKQHPSYRARGGCAIS